MAEEKSTCCTSKPLACFSYFGLITLSALNLGIGIKTLLLANDVEQIPEEVSNFMTFEAVVALSEGIIGSFAVCYMSVGIIGFYHDYCTNGHEDEMDI